MTPRQSAHQHLPDLDRDWPDWQATFAATLEHFVTPDGTWGADPTVGWPSIPALPWPAPWPPVRLFAESKPGGVRT